MSTSQVNEKLAALTAAGTSVWLDQLRRGMIRGGELARMVQEDSLRGVTSNPAIFEKAILGSSDYDEALTEAAREGLSAVDVYHRLAIKDVQDAADVLRGVYDSSGGEDGYVSFEVQPSLAHDTEGTLAQAREYWKAVDRPNLMIKIPATEAGIPAIEQALYEGMHVNVTLLFAVEAHRKVMAAFISAMKRRHAEGKPLDRHSVASFFVSRVDSEVDARLNAAGNTELLGRAGLANARAAYKAFREVFEGPDFAELAAAGCPVQRPLWASTGVKNPQYSDTMYVDGLAGPHTVNTMPLPTLLAAAEHAEITGATADIDPTADLEALAAAGIDMTDVTDGLLRAGIDAFVVPMDKLLAGIEARRAEVAREGFPQAVQARLPDALMAPIADRLARAEQEDVARRIWSKDPTVWAPEGTPEVANRLGWLTISEKMLADMDGITAFVEGVKADGITDAVLLGMGGSSLAPEVFATSAGTIPGGLKLHVLDSTDPTAIAELAAKVDVARTLFLVSTKSGGTIETRSLFEHFHALQPDGSHYAAITDPGSSLLNLAEEHGFRRAFENDPDIGGRYSALSYFGIVPAALAGIDVRAVLEAAQVAEQNCADLQTPADNAGLWLGVALGELSLQGRDKLTWVVDAPISTFGLWVEQLVAESTGKEGKGILPIADEPLVDPSAYGDDRVFVHLRNPGQPDPRTDEHLDALAAAGHPVITLQGGGVADLGRAFFLTEFATAVAGWVLGINPFDQPNVQEAKDNTQRVLDEGAPELADADDTALAALYGRLQPPHYLAIMGYLPFSAEVDAAVRRLREAIVSRTGVATTFGYGPRFLHSTGQLHKGGPATGTFLQLVEDSDHDEDIPGREFGFHTLISAQADGDLQTLRGHGLPAERVRLASTDIAGGIDALTARIAALG